MGGPTRGSRLVGPIPLLLSFVLFPAAVGIAIVRHGLLDIRLVLSRALLYGLAVSAVIAAYAGIVTGLSLLVPANADRGVSIAAAIVVAIVVAIGSTPVRPAFQRLIDRALYGLRSEPWTAAASIGERLQHDDDLAAALDRTRTAPRLPWLALHGLPEPVPSGTPAAEHAELPLLYGGQTVGTLVVGLRAGEHALHAADRRALDLVATPLAVALHATMLSRQVSQARTAVVEATAAERVRLQRELHDGLGPDLTITVRDDGTPASSWQPGVGLRSLVERAEEVGGRASAGPTPYGWQVRATLPL
ncbi:hypothetical protein OHB01_29335 [Microbispora hainanensis]|uniref:Signal transduction histidine kinase subgroup 3 dimerisation and phosphoacceptor domain-containing protein n=1 Tax=Microbispora hainanensis TaxID=568844 RepID=A0ABZ1SXL3_9ACTN|nr:MULTISPECIES: hypothetical protein [Microbispora]NJP28628.1 hypothetical protein [Microbispora sp. CL1-1]TQS07607.1 hypothetical protein FLW53_31390 [Microbispora sp. SCL1-1]